MSSTMDKEMMGLCLEEEDEPFILPDLPKFSSFETNSRSPVGRLLNPDKQKMSSLIFDMPRKWQKQGKVRGIALSQERFQFVFNSLHDLEDILDKGVHTYKEWALAIEKWVETPPKDYLQFIPLWVQIRNIPINHYTLPAITALGELIGQVTEVAFDPSRFDVSKSLRKSKVVILPNGERTEVNFNYERIQKRCYHCQRLNHEKDLCLVLVQQRQQDKAKEYCEKNQGVIKEVIPRITSPNDPVFGVLFDHHLLESSSEDREAREERVRASVREFAKDQLACKTILPLEPPSIDKGKGHVFNYKSRSLSPVGSESKVEVPKLMAQGHVVQLSGPDTMEDLG